MKQLIKLGLIFTIATAGLIFTACEDGEPGIAGAQGGKGEKGDTGDNGENATGYSEATQYGAIAIRYKGIRIDNVPFDKTINFKYAPTGPDLTGNSTVWDYNYDQTDLEFSVFRHSSVVISERGADGGGSNNTVGFMLRVFDDGERESYIQIFNNVAIISDDFKFFTLFIGENQFSVSETVSDYSFNSATGELKFKFETTFPANENPTGHELTLSADVNVKVLENVESPR